jgi:nucleotide-binding universal stress UspA family protein
MNVLVLATDGSPSATKATAAALELARELDADLVAVGVEHVPVPAYGYYGYADIVTELSVIEREHVDTVLTGVQTAATEAGIRCQLVHATGSVAEEICSVAAEHDARLVVIGAHGWGPARRLMHGSVSSAVLQQAPCPVLVVRGEQATKTTDAEKQLEEATR